VSTIFRCFSNNLFSLQYFNIYY